MMLLVLILALELLALYLLSRRLTQNLYVTIFLLFRSRPVAVSFLSILFFPGTVIHELAHLFTAEILGVRTGGLTLVPEGLEKTNVQTGSVSIAQSDPIRRAIIGIAPIIWGLGALGLISYFMPQLEFPILLLLYYLLFAVSNTMFSSPEDLDGFWPVAALLILIAAAAYIVGIRISLTTEILMTLDTFFTSVSTNLGWVVGLNIGIFLVSKLLIVGVEKITKRKLLSR